MRLVLPIIQSEVEPKSIVTHSPRFPALRVRFKYFVRVLLTLFSAEAELLLLGLWDSEHFLSGSFIGVVVVFVAVGSVRNAFFFS